MSSKGVIIGLTALIGTLAVAGRFTINRLKERAANIEFNINFNRIHGFMGEGITRFLSPIIRTYFTISLKNFSGLNLSANRIYTRIEVQRPGSLEWTVIATQVDYLNVSVTDGQTKNIQVPVDIKGFSAIASITNRQNKHRAVVSYQLKGVNATYVKDLNISGSLFTWYDQQKKKFPALAGVGNQFNCLSKAF